MATREATRLYQLISNNDSSNNDATNNGERKICSTIKNSQDIIKMTVASWAENAENAVNFQLKLSNQIKKKAKQTK